MYSRILFRWRDLTTNPCMMASMWTAFLQNGSSTTMNLSEHQNRPLYHTAQSTIVRTDTQAGILSGEMPLSSGSVTSRSSCVLSITASHPHFGSRSLYSMNRNGWMMSSASGPLARKYSMTALLNPSVSNLGKTYPFSARMSCAETSFLPYSYII